MKKLIASLGGLTVLAALALGSAPAFAEDAPPPEDSTVAVEAPVTAPEPPVAEEPVVPPAEAPAEAPAEVPAEVPAEEPAPESFLRLVPETTNSVEIDVDYVTVAWLAGDAPPDHFDIPQTYLFHEYTEDPSLSALDDEIAALLAERGCGEEEVDIQVDVYLDDPAATALIMGHILYGPNDPTEHLIPGGSGTAWKFVHADATEECPPPPVACETVSGWFTEADDNAPVQGQYGLEFDGGSGKAVGIGIGVTGNLQGLPTINYSATGDLGVFYPRIVINSLADGGYAYDSLTVISEGPVTGSSIAASNKRAFIQHTLDEWAALLPHNSLVALFFHLDSGATAEQSVTLASVSSEGCGNANWVPEKPKSVYDKDKDRTVDCEAGEATITKTVTRADYTWSDEAHAYVLGEPYVIHQNSWTDELTEEEYLECYGEQPDPLTGSDSTSKCDAAVLVTTTTSWTQEYVATQTGWVLGEKVFADPTVTRAPDATCKVTETLANTGYTLLVPLGGSAIAALIAGVWFLVRRSKTSEA